jgi:hypothetical protein
MKNKNAFGVQNTPRALYQLGSTLIYHLITLNAGQTSVFFTDCTQGWSSPKIFSARLSAGDRALFRISFSVTLPINALSQYIILPQFKNVKIQNLKNLAPCVDFCVRLW